MIVTNVEVKAFLADRRLPVSPSGWWPINDAVVTIIAGNIGGQDKGFFSPRPTRTLRLVPHFWSVQAKETGEPAHTVLGRSDILPVAFYFRRKCRYESPCNMAFLVPIYT